jgi:hypothetical protein
MVLSLGLRRMISSPQHLRLQSIEVRFEACLVHLVGVSSSEEEDMDGIEEEDGHDSEEEHAHVREEDGREQDH